MGGADPAASQGERPHGPSGRGKNGSEVGRRHDVGDRVPSAYFVELHICHLDAMHLRFRPCEMLEDGQGAVAHCGVERRLSDPGTYPGPTLVRAAAVVMAVMFLMAVIVVAMSRVPLSPRRGQLDGEAAALEHAVMVREQPASHRL